MAADEQPPDFGLVAPLAIPPESRVPDGLTEGSDEAEYDRYFRILRDDPGLLDWTRNCLRVEADLLDDLERSSLSAEEREKVLEGLLAIHRVTLERWLAAGETAARALPTERANPEPTNNDHVSPERANKEPTNRGRASSDEERR